MPEGILQYFDDEKNLKFNGEINCLTINENTTVMSGKVRHYKWDVDYEITENNMYSQFKVVDNGEDNYAPPDETSLVLAPIPYYDCGDWPVPLFEIENGNFQVKP